MLRLALILCSLAMTSTVLAHPFVYDCAYPSGQITLKVAVASKDMISVSRFKKGQFEELKVWVANGQAREILEFNYPQKNVHIRAPKDMMERGQRRVAFSYDKQMPVFICLRRY